MPKVTPKKVEEKIEQTVNAWEQFAPAKLFGGMTLTQFQTVVAASTSARDQIDQLQNQLAAAINQREAADNISLNKIQLVVNGVLGDPAEGPDGSIYEAMGYTRKSERKSGLTKKKKTPKP